MAIAAPKSTSLSIFRATDNLLYFPIYLAIDSLARSEQLSFARSKDSSLSVWSNDKFSVTLHAPSNDDTKCLSEMQECKADAAIAVTDALQLLSIGDAKPFRIAAVLVDRATVWLVYRTDGPEFGKFRRFLELRKWGRVGDFPWAEPFPKDLKLGGVSTGVTNRYIASALLRKSGFDVHARGFGLDEYEVLKADDCIAVLTSSPWLHDYYKRKLDVALAKRIKLTRIAPLFPLPFAAIVSTDEFLGRDGESGIIRKLVKHLLVAIYFTYRYPHLAENRLVAAGAQFGWYGLRDLGDFDSEATRKEARRVIRDAVSWAVDNDLFSSDLTSSWVAWDAAFELTARDKGAEQIDLRLINTWYDVHVRPWNVSFLDYKVTTDQPWDKTPLCQYWREEFRRILMAMLDVAGGDVGSRIIHYEAVTP